MNNRKKYYISAQFTSKDPISIKDCKHLVTEVLRELGSEVQVHFIDIREGSR